MGKFVNHCTVRNEAWRVWQNDDGTYPEMSVQRAILLDIREELCGLRQIFQCTNAQQIPATLKRIAANTTKKRRTR